MSFPRYLEYKDSSVDWLGEVPTHWEVGPLKRYWTVTDCKHVTAEFVDDGIPIASIREVQGWWIDLEKAKCTTEIFYELLIEGGRRPRPGDLIFSRNATVGEVGQVHSDHPRFAMGQDVVLLRKLSPELSSDYMQQVIRSPTVTQQLAMLMIGSTFKRINVEEIRSLVVPAPPVAEQNKIAAFLDHETAKIDALVAEQQRLIELLKEKRQAVISHSVTKGLNPDASMKPSGVEWLGDVPAHWRVVPLGKVTTSRCDGPFGSGLKSEHYTDCGVRVIRLQNIRRDGFLGTDEAFIDSDYYERELSGHDVVAGDVLIAGLGDDNNTVGRACVAPRGIEPAMVKADCFRFRLDRMQATPDFVATVLSAGAATDAGFLSSGSTRSRISLSVMATRKLALPPVAEQEEIAAYLSAAALKFDTLSTEAQRAIDLLQERRAALISAAVTGQIDVRAIADRAAA